MSQNNNSLKDTPEKLTTKSITGEPDQHGSGPGLPSRLQFLLCSQSSTMAGQRGRAFMTICWQKINKLDPVGSTVRYEMMKLCTGSV